MVLFIDKPRWFIPNTERLSFFLGINNNFIKNRAAFDSFNFTYKTRFSKEWAVFCNDNYPVTRTKLGLTCIQL